MRTFSPNVITSYQFWNSPCLFSFYSALYNRSRPCSPLGKRYSTPQPKSWQLRVPHWRRFSPSSSCDWLLSVSWHQRQSSGSSRLWELPVGWLVTVWIHVRQQDTSCSCNGPTLGLGHVPFNASMAAIQLALLLPFPRSLSDLIP